MSTLYRCDTCGKLLRHCAPHSREIAPPVVVRGIPKWMDERTFCSAECAVPWFKAMELAEITGKRAATTIESVCLEVHNAGTTS